MKRFSFLVFIGALLLMPLACTALEDTDDLGRFSGFSIMVDKSQTNKDSQQAFCHEWAFSKTQIEVWDDGQLTEIKDVDNVFPYTSFKFKEDWTMVAQEMNGKWLYSYNHLFIDCIGSGGSSYAYQVAELTPFKLVIREEDLPVGGVFRPSWLFFNNPAGRHVFYRFTYTRKVF